MEPDGGDDVQPGCRGEFMDVQRRLTAARQSEQLLPRPGFGSVIGPRSGRSGLGRFRVDPARDGRCRSGGSSDSPRVVGDQDDDVAHGRFLFGSVDLVVD